MVRHQELTYRHNADVPCAVQVGYGSREASCHSANSRLYPDARSVALANALVAEGYVHAPNATPADPKLLLEVYPHAGMVALFDLPKTLKYKKGTLPQKRLGLQSLVAHLRRLCAAVPALCLNERLQQLLSRELTHLSGLELKMHEDTLDALFCGYLAYYFWYWRMDRNEVFGTVDSGYILNPTLSSGGIEGHGI